MAGSETSGASLTRTMAQVASSGRRLDTCEDSSTWHQGTNLGRDCSWVATKFTVKRCRDQTSTEGVVANEACRFVPGVLFVDHVLLPDDNRKDFDELPHYLKEGITAHFATSFQDVVDLAFQDPDGH